MDGWKEKEKKRLKTRKEKEQHDLKDDLFCKLAPSSFQNSLIALARALQPTKKTGQKRTGQSLRGRISPSPDEMKCLFNNRNRSSFYFERTIQGGEKK